MMGIPAVVATLAETTFSHAAKDLVDLVKASEGYDPINTTSSGVLMLDNLEWTVTTVLSVKPFPKRKDMN